MYLAIDYGRKRIGLALGEMMPKGAGVIKNGGSLSEIASLISEKIKEHQVQGVVIGIPIRSGGEEGELGGEIRELSDLIEKDTGLPVYLEEEQFTSNEASAILHDKKDIKKGDIDEMAAVLILEQFLNDQITNGQRKS